MFKKLYRQYTGASGAENCVAPVQKAYSYNTGAIGAVAPVYSAECTGAVVQIYLGKVAPLHRLKQLIIQKGCGSATGAEICLAPVQKMKLKE